MSTPEALAHEVITRGTRWRVRLQLQDALGAALNLTPATVDVVLRIKPRSGVAYTRSKSVPGETTYATNGSDGDITFVTPIAATLAFALGHADVEVVYSDSTVSEKILPWTWEATVADPKTGAI